MREGTTYFFLCIHHERIPSGIGKRQITSHIHTSQNLLTTTCTVSVFLGSANELHEYNSYRMLEKHVLYNICKHCWIWLQIHEILPTSIGNYGLLNRHSENVLPLIDPSRRILTQFFSQYVTNRSRKSLYLHFECSSSPIISYFKKSSVERVSLNKPWIN